VRNGLGTSRLLLANFLQGMYSRGVPNGCWDAPAGRIGLMACLPFLGDYWRVCNRCVDDTAGIVGLLVGAADALEIDRRAAEG
jgi:hypothetical protein